MDNDNDACVPQAVKDFVFDLYDSVTASQFTEEQMGHYNTAFRDLSAKYFGSTPWPSPQAIVAECNGDPLFLGLYREMTHRHWHSIARPGLRDHLEGWEVYRDLFEEILDDAEDFAFSEGQDRFFILPEWAFDVLNEFVYEFQGFCQLRTGLHNSASRHNLLSGTNLNGEPLINTNPSGKVHPNVIDSVTAVAQCGGDVWSAETVCYYLHRLITIGMSPNCKSATFQYLGIFASVALSRLECLIGDYTGSLEAMAPILDTNLVVKKADIDTKTAREVIEDCVAARLSLSYHAGVSFLMMRRLKDASVVLGDNCSFVQRAMKTGQLRKLQGSDQFVKTFDRMIALLAICMQLSPLVTVDESIQKVIREKHGQQLGQGKLTDLFANCSPKFINPAYPDFTTPNGGQADNAPKSQIRLFEQNILTRYPSMSKLRSYLKLYTSIAISKLESFENDAKNLLALKLYMRQLESSDSYPSLANNTYRSALDIHYYIEGDVVQVDEAEKQRRFENYFFGQIAQSMAIHKDASAISTKVGSDP